MNNFEIHLNSNFGKFSPYSFIIELLPSNNELASMAAKMVENKNIESYSREFKKIRLKQGDKIAFEVLKELTKFEHEYKHFIDFFSTTFGYYVHLSYAQMVFDFIKVTDSIHSNTICLPLNKWACKKDCPIELRNWTESFYEYHLAMQVIFGNFELPFPLEEKYSLYKMPFGGNFLIPIYSFDKNVGYFIGAATFLESLAFNFQSTVILNRYGKDIFSFWISQSEIDFLQGNRKYLGLSMIHLMKFKRLFLLLDYSVSDDCLIIKPKTSELSNISCPGTEYLNLYNSIKNFSTNEVSSNEAEHFNYIKENILNLELSKSIIADEIKKGFGPTFPTNTINLSFKQTIILNLHNCIKEFCNLFEKMFTYRLSNWDAFIHQSKFLDSLPNLPSPISIIDREKILEDDKPSFLISKGYEFIEHWLIYVEFILSLYECSSLICPIKKLALPCSFEFEGCGINKNYFSDKNSTCSYGEMLKALNFNEKNIIYLK